MKHSPPASSPRPPAPRSVIRCRFFAPPPLRAPPPIQTLSPRVAECCAILFDWMNLCVCVCSRLRPFLPAFPANRRVVASLIRADVRKWRAVLVVCVFPKGAPSPRGATPSSATRPFSSPSVAMVKAVKAAPKKRIRARTAQEVVNQSLRDNFKNWSVECIDIIKKDNMTLRQRLHADLNSGKQVTRGGLYYSKLRAIYRASDDPEMKLKPSAAAGEIVSPALFSAMVAAQKVRPDRYKLQAWCANLLTAPNETEVCGVLLYFLRMRVLCQKQAPLALDILRMCKRFSIPTLFPERWQVVMDRADMLLEDCWLKSHHSLKIDRMQFVTLHSKILSLLIPETALKAIIAHKETSYQKVKKEYQDAVSSSRVGSVLFGFALASMLAEDVAEIVQKELDKAWKGSWTVESCQKVQVSALAAAQALPGLDLLPSARKVTWSYLGCVLDHSVQSLQEEIAFKTHCCWRAAALIGGKLTPLWIEDPPNVFGAKLFLVTLRQVSVSYKGLGFQLFFVFGGWVGAAKKRAGDAVPRGECEEGNPAGVRRVPLGAYSDRQGVVGQGCHGVRGRERRPA